jgi:general secretion pathway protein B
MSFILDALRKSENSRLRQEHPAMFDARAVASRRPFPVWAVALGLLLGLNLLVVLFVLLRQERKVVDAVADKVAVTASSTAPVAAAAAALDTPPAAATASVARADVAPPALPTASPAAAPATSVPLPSARRPVPGTVTRDTTVDGRAFDAATPRAPSRAPSRTRDDLLAGGDAVPEAALSLHVYDPDPAARFILLNGQRLREGDMAGNGLRVLDIVPDGVVLDHRGNTFKVSIDP